MLELAGSRLEPLQAARAVRWILGRCPDQLWLPFALCTRESVQQLLSREFGIEVGLERRRPPDVTYKVLPVVCWESGC